MRIRRIYSINWQWADPRNVIDTYRAYVNMQPNLSQIQVSMVIGLSNTEKTTRTNGIEKCELDQRMAMKNVYWIKAQPLYTSNMAGSRNRRQPKNRRKMVSHHKPLHTGATILDFRTNDQDQRKMAFLFFLNNYKSQTNNHQQTTYCRAKQNDKAAFFVALVSSLTNLEGRQPVTRSQKC